MQMCLDMTVIVQFSQPDALQLCWDQKSQHCSLGVTVTTHLEGIKFGKTGIVPSTHTLPFLRAFPPYWQHISPELHSFLLLMSTSQALYRSKSNIAEKTKCTGSMHRALSLASLYTHNTHTGFMWQNCSQSVQIGLHQFISTLHVTEKNLTWLYM